MIINYLFIDLFIHLFIYLLIYSSTHSSISSLIFLAAKRSETGGLTALLKNSENRLQIISKKVYDGEIGTREELNKIINDIMELRKGELLLV